MKIADRIAGKLGELYRFIRFFSGTEQSLYPWKKSGRLAVMYHNVLPYDAPAINIRQMTVEDFRSQIVYLKKRYRIVTLAEFFSGNIQGNCITITFDDGLVNNFRFALPVLEELEVPAAFFVSTPQLLGQQFLWPDALELACYFNHDAIDFANETFYREGLFHINRKGERLVHCIKHLPPDSKWAFIDELAAAIGKRPWEEPQWENHCRVMNDAELRKLSQSPLVEIGSHCIAHSNLEGMSDEETLHELTASKSYLEKITGKNIQALAFPDGSYTRRTVELAQQAGYARQLAVALRYAEDPADSTIAGRFGFYSNSSCTEQLHAMNKFFHQQNLTS